MSGKGFVFIVLLFAEQHVSLGRRSPAHLVADKRLIRTLRVCCHAAFLNLLRVTHTEHAAALAVKYIAGSSVGTDLARTRINKLPAVLHGRQLDLMKCVTTLAATR